jgi:hypothetical protein
MRAKNKELSYKPLSEERPISIMFKSNEDVLNFIEYEMQKGKVFVFNFGLFLDLEVIVTDNFFIIDSFFNRCPEMMDDFDYYCLSEFDSFEVAYSVAQLFREEADNEFSNKMLD